jgi:hypothetical protein
LEIDFIDLQLVSALLATQFHTIMINNNIDLFVEASTQRQTIDGIALEPPIEFLNQSNKKNYRAWFRIQLPDGSTREVCAFRNVPKKPKFKQGETIQLQAEKKATDTRPWIIIPEGV